MRQLLIALTSIFILGIGFYALAPSISATATKSTAKLVSEPAPSCEAFDERPNRTVSKLDTPALALKHRAIDGSMVDFDKLLEKGPVLLEFFASWCPHCQHSVAGVKSLQQAFGDKLSIVAINAGDRPGEPSTSSKFKNVFEITYPILDGVDDSVYQHYCLAGFPTFYLIEPSGKISWRFIGTLEDIALQALKSKVTTLTSDNKNK